MRRFIFVIISVQFIAAAALSAEGKKTHGLFGLGIARAIGEAGTRQSLGGSAYAGIMFPLTSNLDLNAKAEYFNAPINRGAWEGGIRYHAFMIGPQLMYAPHDRDSHFGSVLLAGLGSALGGVAGGGQEFKFYTEAGVGLKLVYRTAPSPMFLIRVLNFQLHGSAYTFISISFAAKF